MHSSLIFNPGCTTEAAKTSPKVIHFSFCLFHDLILTHTIYIALKIRQPISINAACIRICKRHITGGSSLVGTHIKHVTFSLEQEASAVVEDGKIPNHS